MNNKIEKKEYQAPVMQRLGELSELTQGIGTGPAEQSVSPDPRLKRP